MVDEMGRISPEIVGSLKEAIHRTVTRGTLPMKAIAAELDWSPSQLSMAVTLGEENTRAFPADDAHLVKLMRVTSDPTILYTLAELLGYEVRPKEINLPTVVTEMRDTFRTVGDRLERLLAVIDQRAAP